MGKKKKVRTFKTVTISSSFGLEREIGEFIQKHKMSRAEFQRRSSALLMGAESRELKANYYAVKGE